MHCKIHKLQILWTVVPKTAIMCANNRAIFWNNGIILAIYFLPVVSTTVDIRIMTIFAFRNCYLNMNFKL